MKYSVLYERFTKLKEDGDLEIIPSTSDLAEILNVSYSTMAARKQRDSEFSDEEIQRIEAHRGIFLSWVADPNCVELEYYPDVFGSCGTGVFVFSEEKEKISLSKDSIANYSANANYSVINAIGDSMTPYIHDKDKLIVKHWEGEQIKDNSVYVFRYFDEIFVKRLSKNLDQIIITSDNPIYETRKINMSQDFQIIGQIVGLLRYM